MSDTERFFSSKTSHHPDLEGAIVKALEREDYHLAFGLADRRCRLLPRPNARVHMLRAEALHQLGLTTAALDDVATARELDPDDVVAARRMLLWGDGDERLEAAIAIARFDNDIERVKSALSLLALHGKPDFYRVNVHEGAIAGWVTWPRGSNLTITLSTSDLVQSIKLTEQPNHQLATPTQSIADFRLARPASEEIQSLRILRDDIVVLDDPLPPNRSATVNSPVARNGGEAIADNGSTLTVIVPIYRDVSATSACLSSLHDAMLRTPNCRALLVDDASPEESVKRLVAQYGEHELFRLITNERNLGFVGAVNRALDMIPAGDVLLLNADTLLPADALNGLRTAVTKTPGIGTATPLSNNGEFTSFPVAYRINAMPDGEVVAEFNSKAAVVNAEEIVDIPNGIGFCLYVTRACLNAVRGLSLDFHRGYLEDVDFCLRAAEAGFRNVCVPSVYVGHVGSRSFRQDKRSLVVRNLRLLQARYPRYEAECAAFMLADPLHGVRSSLEQALLPHLARGNLALVLSGKGASKEIAAARARNLTEKGQRSWVVAFEEIGGELRATVISPDENPPQSLEFHLADGAQLDRLLELLRKGSESGLEILAPELLPSGLVDLIHEHSVPYNLLLTDTALAAHPERNWGVRPKWKKLVGNARSIIALDQRGAHFAKEVLAIDARSDFRRASGKALNSNSRRPVLGVVVTRCDASEFEFLRSLALAIASTPAFRIVAIGKTIDDVKIMQLPNVLVTGSVGEGDVRTLLQGHGISKIVLDAGTPTFAHPVQVACQATKLPCAFFGWNDKHRKSDLRLAPSASRQTQVELIARWALA